MRAKTVMTSFMTSYISKIFLFAIIAVIDKAKLLHKFKQSTIQFI